MDFEIGGAATTLRQELRRLVKENVAEDYLGAFTPDPADLETAQAFCRLLAERDLLCMAWPPEFGGRGASIWEQTVVREEMWAHHEPRGAQYMGVNWVGPTIMRHGTPEQQAAHLPAIARGEVIWCQGFSEPEAGSDLASLRTSATRDGEGWIVNGQKIWTSYATMAQWCFLLARTTKLADGARKQSGLTIFLVPMSNPAVTVRPIGCMMGPHHLNEVFFDGLRVTEADVLGSVDDGWSIVSDVLAFERVGIARYARCERLLHLAPSALGNQWDHLPAELHGRWTRMLTHCRRARLLAYRLIALQAGGQVSPTDSAAYRIAVTKLDQDSAEVLMEIVAAADDTAELFRAEVEDHWRYAQASTVSSGSIEMQRILLSFTAEDPMIVDMSDEAKEFGRQALRAFEAAGGDLLVQRAEKEPYSRGALVGPVLEQLGVFDLAPRDDADSLEAAAAVCRSAGHWALPYPVAERLARPPDLDVAGLTVVAGARPAAAIGGTDLRWAAVSLDGHRHLLTVTSAPGAAFVSTVDLAPLDDNGTADLALALTLPCWTLLGMLDRAIELTIAHVQLRQQFGQPLSRFQSVQFQLTDAEVERAGLEMLAKYTLWSVGEMRAEALDDALALRTAALEAAEVVFRVAHQLHGAIGFCDETTLSWLSRHSQPLRRLPLGLSATRDILTSRVRRTGLVGLYDTIGESVQ